MPNREEISQSTLVPATSEIVLICIGENSGIPKPLSETSNLPLTPAE